MPNTSPPGTWRAPASEEVRASRAGTCSALARLTGVVGEVRQRRDANGRPSRATGRRTATAVTPSSTRQPVTVPLSRPKKYRNLCRPDSCRSTSASDVSPRCCSTCGLCGPSGAERTIFSAIPAQRRDEELQAQRPHRQAVGARVHALAGEAGGEGRAHDVVEAAIGGAGHARGRRDALAPDQRDLGIGRDRTRALQRHAARLLRHQATAFRDRVARGAGDDPSRAHARRRRANSQ